MLTIEQQPHSDPAKGILFETWRANEWVFLISAAANSSGQWTFQIYLPTHQVGEWMGRETEEALDHPEAAALVQRLCDELAIAPKDRSLGDFRFHTRQEWQRVCEALRDALSRYPQPDCG